jgi:hypothetical protein
LELWLTELQGKQFWNFEKKLLLISALYEGEWSASHSDCSTHKEYPVTTGLEAGRVQHSSGQSDKEKISYTVGN